MGGGGNDCGFPDNYDDWIMHIIIIIMHII